MSWWPRRSKWFRAVTIVAQVLLVPFLLLATVAILLAEDFGALGFPLAAVGVALLAVANLGWTSPRVRGAGWVLIVLGLSVSILLSALTECQFSRYRTPEGVSGSLCWVLRCWLNRHDGSPGCAPGACAGPVTPPPRPVSVSGPTAAGPQLPVSFIRHLGHLPRRGAGVQPPNGSRRAFHAVFPFQDALVA